MPKRFYVINLTSGGEEGRVTYNVPASASISECNTRLALARRDGFDTVEQKIEALQRETEALVTLATESLRMLHDEWDGYKSDIILTKEEKEAWAEDYGTFAIALGQFLFSEFLGKTAAFKQSDKVAAIEPTPEVSGDAVNPT